MFCSILYVEFNDFVVPDSVFKTYSYIKYYECFKLSKLLGGGGGAKAIYLPPQYFLGGCPLPLSPMQDRRLCWQRVNISTLLQIGFAISRMNHVAWSIQTEPGEWFIKIREVSAVSEFSHHYLCNGIYIRNLCVYKKRRDEKKKKSIIFLIKINVSSIF